MNDFDHPSEYTPDVHAQLATALARIEELEEEYGSNLSYAVRLATEGCQDKNLVALTEVLAERNIELVERERHRLHLYELCESMMDALGIDQDELPPPRTANIIKACRDLRAERDDLAKVLEATREVIGGGGALRMARDEHIDEAADWDKALCDASGITVRTAMDTDEGC